MASNYAASSDVIAAHNIPHLNKHFQQSSNQFSFGKSYFISLLPFPMLILAICLAMTFLFSIVIFCKGCFNCLKAICCCCCRTPSDADEDKKNEVKIDQIVKAQHLRWGLMFCLGALFILDFFIFIGDAQVSSAFQNLANSINIIETAFDAVITAASDIINDSVSLTNLLVSSTCQSVIPPSTVNSIENNMTSISGFSDSLQSISNPVNNNLNIVTNTLTGYATKDKTEVVVVYFFAIFFLVLLFSIALYTKRTWIYRLALSFTWFVVLALFVICCLEMVVVMFVADFCMNPSGNILSILGSGQVYNVFNYYLTCSGSSPFTPYINDLQTYIVGTNNTVNSLVASTGSNDCSSGCQSFLNDMNYQLSVVNSQLGCGPIESAWDQAIGQALCTTGFAGLYSSWIVQFLEAATLFVIMCVSNALYNHPAFALDTPVESDAGKDDDIEMLPVNMSESSALANKDWIDGKDAPVEAVAVISTASVTEAQATKSPLYNIDLQESNRNDEPEEKKDNGSGPTSTDVELGRDLESGGSTSVENEEKKDPAESNSAAAVKTQTAGATQPSRTPPPPRPPPAPPLPPSRLQQGSSRVHDDAENDANVL